MQDRAGIPDYLPRWVVILLPSPLNFLCKADLAFNTVLGEPGPPGGCLQLGLLDFDPPKLLLLSSNLFSIGEIQRNSGLTKSTELAFSMSPCRKKVRNVTPQLVNYSWS